MKKISKNQYVCIECGKSFAEEVDPNSLGAIYFPEAKLDSPICQDCLDRKSRCVQPSLTKLDEEIENCDDIISLMLDI